jgi:hypothetical protein
MNIFKQELGIIGKIIIEQDQEVIFPIKKISELSIPLCIFVMQMIVSTEKFYQEFVGNRTVSGLSVRQSEVKQVVMANKPAHLNSL